METARELFQKAKNAETECRYKEARELYKKAKMKFLDTNDEKIFALRCVADLARNKVNAKRLKGVNLNLHEETIDESYSEIVGEIRRDLKEVKKKIFRTTSEEFFSNYHKFESKWRVQTTRLHNDVINYIISLYKELEIFFFSEGLTEESIEMYKQIQHEKIEKYQYDRSMPGESGNEKFNYRIRQYVLMLWGWVFGFGISAKHLIIVTLTVTIVCGFLYCAFGLVGFENKFKENQNTIQPISSDLKILGLSSKSDISHGLYYSIVSITNLGSETHFPTSFLGRLIQSMEGIIGYIILGVLVAFLTRRIK